MSAIADRVRAVSVLARYRCGLLSTTGAAAWVMALVVATAACYDLAVAELAWDHVAWFAAAATALQTAIGLATGLYRGKRRIGSFDEADLLGRQTVDTDLVQVAGRPNSRPPRHRAHRTGPRARRWCRPPAAPLPNPQPRHAPGTEGSLCGQ